MAISATVVAMQQQNKDVYFSEAERKAIKAFWQAPGRASVTPMPAFQLRLTVEGSTWLAKFNQAKGLSKGSATPTTPLPSDCDIWLDMKLSYELEATQAAVDQLNGKEPLPAKLSDPGPPPVSLVDRTPALPTFYEAVRPNLITVDFGDGVKLSAQDSTKMAARSPYFRFKEGVRVFGTPVKNLSPEELNALFREAGYSEAEQAVTCAVSSLEGGFDAVNTYDTGFISIGFIQFACLSKGQGSLGQALLSMKFEHPEAFARDFRAFGLDVSDSGALVCYDIETDTETIGSDAARIIILRPALSLVFQRAGLAREFRIAQLRTAKALYYPSEPVQFVLQNQPVTVTPAELFSSQAGFATLMDRKVHTGTLDPLPKVLTELGAELGLTDVSQLKAFEAEIIARVTHRRSFLSELSLSQPDPKTKLRDTSKSSRGGGTRKGNGG